VAAEQAARVQALEARVAALVEQASSYEAALRERHVPDPSRGAGGASAAAGAEGALRTALAAAEEMVLRMLADVMSLRCFERPKSAIFNTLPLSGAVRSMLVGLMSRCMTPALCRKSMHLAAKWGSQPTTHSPIYEE
jgi:hypothetical protein